MSTGTATSGATTEPTATRLLDAAERIFADEGLEAASIRAITQAAGANLAAISYHFGSKQELVHALLERRVTEMHEARRPLLDAALAAPAVDARAIAEVWVRPLARLALDPERRAYLGFLAVLNGAAPELRDLTRDVFRRQQDDFETLLARAMPDLSGPERWFRFSNAIDTTVRVLADVGRAAQPWRATGGLPDRALVDHLVDLVTSMLTPVPGATISGGETS